MLILFSCAGEIQDPIYYADDQISTIKNIIGDWSAQHSWFHEKLNFENHVDFTEPPNWIIIGDLYFQVHGDCTYSSKNDTVHCFFEIAKDCDRLRLLDKQDSTIFRDYVEFLFWAPAIQEIWVKQRYSTTYQIFEK